MFVVSKIYKQFKKEDPSVYSTLKSSFVSNSSLCLIFIHSKLYEVLSGFFPKSVQKYGQKTLLMLE